MKTYDLEVMMKKHEIFKDLKVLPNAYIVVRVDGRGFHNFTKEYGFQKPFDERLHEMMVSIARGLMFDFGGMYGYTESDEISILFPRSFDLYDRRVEKINTAMAAQASAHLSILVKQAQMFDSRIWVGSTAEDVYDYFSWRQWDATRCCINGYAYHLLRQQGLTARQATKMLDGKNEAFKHDLLMASGINFNDLPAWQKRGTELCIETYIKDGENPKTGQKTKAIRRRISATPPGVGTSKDFGLFDAFEEEGAKHEICH